MSDSAMPLLEKELAHLGDPLAEFQVRGTAYIVTLIGAVLAGIVGSALLVFCLIILANPNGQDERAIVLVRMFIGGIVLLVVSVQLWIKAGKMKRMRVRVFRDGLARLGDTIELLRWDQVNKLWRMVRSSGERAKKGQTLPGIEVILELEGGRRMSFDDTLSDLKRLRTLAEEQTLGLLLPPALEAVRGGAEIGFGPVSVSGEGLHHRDETLPWSFYSRVEVSSGSILVYRVDYTRPFCKVSLTDVPNLHVLQALGQTLAGQRTG